MANEIDRRHFLGAGALVFGSSLFMTAARAQQSVGSENSTLRVGVVGPTLASIDPNTTLRTGSQSLVWAIYSRLTYLDEAGQVKPSLATSWERESPTVWVFKLDPEVSFENGVALDADVVVWNLRHIFDPTTAPSPALRWRASIDSVTKVDTRTIRIVTKQPILQLPNYLATVFFQEPGWAASHKPTSQALGSGPYRLETFVNEQQATLVRSNTYRGPKPVFDKIVVNGYASEATRLNALRNHEIDATLTINPSNFPSLLSVPGLKIGGEPGQRIQTLQFNFNRKPFQDIRVRQALNYAIDRESITKSVYKGTTSPNRTQVISRFYSGYDPDATVWGYDPEKSARLLTEAGYSKGFTVNVNVPSQTYAGAELAIQIIKQEWAKLGVTLDISVLPSGPWGDLNTTSDLAKAPDLIYWGIQNANLDSLENLRSWKSDYRDNDGVLPNHTEFDTLLNQAANAITDDEQLSLVRQANGWLRDNAALIYLWDQPQTYAYSDQLKWSPRYDDWFDYINIGKAG